MPVPPQEVRKAAARALELRRERARTTQRPGGTAVGVARARDLVNGRNLTLATIKRMRSFFARHDTEEEREARRTDPDTRWHCRAALVDTSRGCARRRISNRVAC